MVNLLQRMYFEWYQSEQSHSSWKKHDQQNGTLNKQKAKLWQNKMDLLLRYDFQSCTYWDFTTDFMGRSWLFTMWYIPKGTTLIDTIALDLYGTLVENVAKKQLLVALMKILMQLSAT